MTPGIDTKRGKPPDGSAAWQPRRRRESGHSNNPLCNWRMLPVNVQTEVAHTKCSNPSCGLSAEGLPQSSTVKNRTSERLPKIDSHSARHFAADCAILLHMAADCALKSRLALGAHTISDGSLAPAVDSDQVRESGHSPDRSNSAGGAARVGPARPQKVALGRSHSWSNLGYSQLGL